MIRLEGQLGLGKRRVCDIVQEMTNAVTGVLGSIICFLCQGHHSLKSGLVVFSESGKHEPTFDPL